MSTVQGRPPDHAAAGSSDDAVRTEITKFLRNSESICRQGVGKRRTDVGWGILAQLAADRGIPNTHQIRISPRDHMSPTPVEYSQEISSIFQVYCI